MEEVGNHGPRRHSMHEVGLLQTSAQILGARFRFGGKPVVAPCRLSGSAPHKSGGRRGKSWPDNTHNTHNTHWVHLNCTYIKQRQYKPDWRCTIHTPTQNVTTTPTTYNTTTKHRHTSNQHNRHQKQNRGTKKTSTQHPTGHHHNTRNKTHTES